MHSVDLLSTLATLFASDKRQACLLVGPPGVGKTAIVAQAARKADLPLSTIALPTCEAVDLRGLPSIRDGRTVWASPLPQGVGVLLLDELSSAPPDVQVAAHHIVWSEQGSDMSTEHHVVLTGNRSTDKTLFRAASGPLRNRLLILNVEPSLDLWIDWAQHSDIRPEIVGFLRWRPKLLATLDIPTDGAFPSPRAWERTSHIISLSLSAAQERECLVGTIGEGAAVEFSAYLRTSRELPAVERIKANPAKALIPAEPSTLYALVSLLAHHTRTTQESLMAYCKRLPAEFALLYVRDIRTDYDIAKDADIRAWIATHPKLFQAEA